MQQPSRSRSRLATVGLLVAVLTLGAAPAAFAQSDVIYTTDFSDPAEAAADWGFQPGETTETGDGYSLDLVPDALVVTMSGLPSFYISPDTDVVGELPDDQVVETTIEEVDGDDSALAGVMCRGSIDDDVGYVFLIGTDGYFTIGDISGKATALVNKKGNKRSDSIDPDGPNTVRGECTTVDRIGVNAVRLTLFVNDEKVASVVDKTAAEVGSEAWIVTEVDEDRGVEVSFSSFTVSGA